MAGQPTLYNEEMQSLADDYLENYTLTDEIIPTVSGLADKLHVVEKTLYNWAKVHPQFLHTLEAIKSKQKTMLMNKGLTGDYQPTITKMMLSANHGMVEKEGREITTIDENGDSVGIKIKFE